MFIEREVRGRVGDREVTATVVVHADDDVFEKACTRDVVVVVPGNPGVSRFYADFLAHLKAAVRAERRYVCLGYAGHTPGRRDGVFGVDDQVAFSADLIDRIRALSSAARLHIIGHSVGAYVGIKLAAQLGDGVGTYSGLFPTVEHIAKGDNAVVRPVFAPGLRHFAAGLAGSLGWLPTSVKKAVAALFAKEATEDHLEVVAKMADYGMINNLLYMAGTEMHAIRDLDPEVLERVAHKSTFYYGKVDGWVPNHLIPTMEEKLKSMSKEGKVGTTPHCPAPRVVRDTTNAPHAFVLSHSKEVAEAIAPTLA